LSIRPSTFPFALAAAMTSFTASTITCGQREQYGRSKFSWSSSADDPLFPYPGTDRLWTEREYRNWREDYFVPIARSHGLGSESDDPYALRHIYATLRIAAHHPTLYIESSMGTGLVGKVYGGVIRPYEGKGPLNIDTEIEAARKAALAKRRSSRSA
jgi:hypothetical protein